MSVPQDVSRGNMTRARLEEVVRTQVTLAAGGAGPICSGAIRTIFEAAEQYAETRQAIPDLFSPSGESGEILARIHAIRDDLAPLVEGGIHA